MKILSRNTLKATSPGSKKFGLQAFSRHLVRLIQIACRPVIGNFLADQRACRIASVLLGVLAGLHLLLPATRLCFIYNLTGFPCPACGLTRSVDSLFHFEFVEAWHLHPFVLAAVPIMALILACAFLPASIAKRLAGAITGLEQRTGIGFILVVLFFVFWTLRLLQLLPGYDVI